MLSKLERMRSEILVIIFCNLSNYRIKNQTSNLKIDVKKCNAPDHNILILNVREILGPSGPSEDGGPGHGPRVPLW